MTRPWERLLETPRDWTLTVLRLVLAGVMFPHGAQKLLGWFGGPGFNGTMGMFTEKMGIHPFLAFLSIVAESLGAIGLAFGFLSRVTALGIGINMLVAMIIGGAINHGFFMNWMGNQQGEGMEYFVLMIGIAVVLIARGGGAWSLDRLMLRSLAQEEAQADTDEALRPAAL